MPPLKNKLHTVNQAFEEFILYLHGLHDFHKVLNESIEFLDKVLKPDTVEIYLLNPDGVLSLAKSKGLTAQQARLAEETCMEGNPGKVLRMGEALLIPDIHSNLEAALKGFRIGLMAESMIFIPIHCLQEVCGVLGLGSRQRNYFSGQYLFQLQTLADNIGIARQFSILEHRPPSMENAILNQPRPLIYKLMVDYAADIMMVVDAGSYGIDEINRAGEIILGYGREELVDFPIMKIIHPDDIRSVMTVIKEYTLEGRNFRNFTCKVITKNRETISLVWNAEIRAGKVYIVARKQNETDAHIAVNERPVHLVLLLSPDGLIMNSLHTDKHPLFELNGQYIHDLITDEQLDEFLEVQTAIIDGKGAGMVRFQLTDKDGETRMVSGKLQPMSCPGSPDIDNLLFTGRLED